MFVCVWEERETGTVNWETVVRNKLGSFSECGGQVREAGKDRMGR